MRRADRTDDSLLDRATLAGGVTFVALTASGFSAEAAYPHMLTRFDAAPDESSAN